MFIQSIIFNSFFIRDVDGKGDPRVDTLSTIESFFLSVFMGGGFPTAFPRRCTDQGQQISVKKK